MATVEKTIKVNRPEYELAVVLNDKGDVVSVNTDGLISSSLQDLIDYETALNELIVAVKQEVSAILAAKIK